jgi:acyl carrier protein
MKQGKVSVARSDADEVEATLRALLAETLGLPAKRIATFDGDTELFGALSEFDSMAVANLLTGMEERLGVLIEDDDVEAEDFMTYGRLLAFAKRKVLQ